ncbi:MAG: 2,5-diamino-6-(ribosylamino)-4(3H)-pyrimidinone 5'-phosphate reductase, partial [Nitrosopumilaceae archaeon]|nr:2,5-diamino-6-(ribosylamino)-4(3H)-pyrimidinone 5'-phosphate reductase [Nitrosopumilaceae archaeon]
CILVGKNTVIKDDPELNVRYSQGKNPIRIVLDSSGIIPNKSKILQTSDKIRTIIVVSEKIPKRNLQRLKNFPIELWIIGKNQINIKSLIKKLGEKKIKSVLLEGGGTLNWEFVKSNLIDEYFITITPFVLGGKNSISLVQGGGFDKIEKSPTIHLKSVKRLKNDLVLHYVKV